jgi:hypothetical protein
MKFIKLLLPVVVLIISVFSVQAQHVSDPSLVAKGAKVYSEIVEDVTMLVLRKSIQKRNGRLLFRI